MGKRTNITVIVEEQKIKVLSDKEAKEMADLVKYHLSLGKTLKQALTDANVTDEQWGILDGAFHISAYKYEGLTSSKK